MLASIPDSRIVNSKFRTETIRLARRFYSSPDGRGFALGVNVLRFFKSFVHDALNFVLAQSSFKYKRLVNDASVAPSFIKYGGSDAEFCLGRIHRVVTIPNLYENFRAWGDRVHRLHTKCLPYLAARIPNESIRR